MQVGVFHAIKDNLFKIIFGIILCVGYVLYIIFVPKQDGISTMHAEAQIQLNGDLLVEETWTVNSNKSPFESFQREYINSSNSAEKYDEFQILEVYINDKLCTLNSENSNEASYVVNESKNKTTITCCGLILIVGLFDVIGSHVSKKKNKKEF